MCNLSGKGLHTLFLGARRAGLTGLGLLLEDWTDGQSHAALREQAWRVFHLNGDLAAITTRLQNLLRFAYESCEQWQLELRCAFGSSLRTLYGSLTLSHLFLGSRLALDAGLSFDGSLTLDSLLGGLLFRALLLTYSHVHFPCELDRRAAAGGDVGKSMTCP